MVTTDKQLTSTALTGDELKALLDGLDKTQGAPEHQRRRHRRLPYRSLRVGVHVLDEQGQPRITFHVPTRNISARGLAFVHKQALAPGQLLRLEIPLLDDQVLVTAGRVARCHHLKGMLHEIGVEFQGPPEKKG